MCQSARQQHAAWEALQAVASTPLPAGRRVAAGRHPPPGWMSFIVFRQSSRGRLKMRRLAFPLIGLMVAFATSGSVAELRSDGPAPVTPTLTPQDSGTTQGLIAVSPVNPEVV